MATVLKNKDELTITRIYDAPRETVWKAWTDPGHFRKWWGPKYFTAPVVNLDFRVGGKYLNCMRGPDGRDYWSTGIYREIVPMEKIVCTDSFADEQGEIVPASHYGMTGDWPLMLRVTVTFEEAGGRTRMTLQHEGIPEGIMREQCEIGWSQSFDKLADVVVASDHTKIIAESGKQDVVVTRAFDAPRSLVFRAYTDRNLLPQWWGPKRFTTDIAKMEAKPGGQWRFVQHDAAGNEYAFHGVYHEVRSPDCIIDTFEFEGAPDHVALEKLILEETGGGTKVTAWSVFQTAGDRDAMVREGMEEGVYESMDRLAELLGKLKIEKKAA